MQPIDEIEKSYKAEDPWHYKTTPDDINRKKKLIDLASKFGPYERALDIGAGEGWITQDLPAKEIHGYEVSDNAASRFPENVKRVLAPQGKYDLILATGIFYGHYNWQLFMEFIRNHASKHILVSSMVPGEHVCVNEIGKVIHQEEFKYRHCNQRTRMFQVGL